LVSPTSPKKQKNTTFESCDIPEKPQENPRTNIFPEVRNLCQNDGNYLLVTGRPTGKNCFSPYQVDKEKNPISLQ
jgi:hypothetical protein